MGSAVLATSEPDAPAVSLLLAGPVPVSVELSEEEEGGAEVGRSSGATGRALPGLLSSAGAVSLDAAASATGSENSMGGGSP